MYTASSLRNEPPILQYHGCAHSCDMTRFNIDKRDEGNRVAYGWFLDKTLGGRLIVPKADTPTVSYGLSLLVAPGFFDLRTWG